MQRVEEEVRVELLLQRLQLRLDEPGFELRGAQRPRRGTRGNRGARGSGRRWPSRSSSPSRDRGTRSAGPAVHQRNSRPSERASHQWTASMPAMCANEKAMTAGRWTATARSRPWRSNRNVLRQPDDRRRHQRPEVPPGEVEDDQRSEAAGHLRANRVNCQASVVDRSRARSRPRRRATTARRIGRSRSGRSVPVRGWRGPRSDQEA